METVPCPHCGAPLKPTATFCLACDTPVVDTRSGLSVAEPVAVQYGRPLVGLAIAVAAVVVVGGASYGAFSIVRHARRSASTTAVSAVTRSVRLLVSAESGHPHACRELHAVSELQRPASPPTATLQAECQALVGHDASARLDRIEVDRTHLSQASGSARVRARVTDDSGRHDVDRTVELVRRKSTWVMDWDGRPLV